MDILQAIILGIVQGLSEFLPVSSSGHLELAKVMLGVDLEGDAGLMLTIYLHLFEFKWKDQTKYLAMIALSMIPAGIVGLFFTEYIDFLFSGNVLLVGSMLIATAALLLLADKAKNTEHPVTMKDSIIIGISQAIDIIPGISRSGATISTSVLLGVDRSEAARFSFLMVLPLIFGQILKDVMEGGEQIASTDWGPVIAGAATAFVVGIAACKWMIKLVRKAQLKWFAYYCIIVGAIAISWALLN